MGKLNRAERMQIVSDIAKEFPVLVQELTQTYSVEEIVTLTKAAIDRASAVEESEQVRSVVVELGKTVGLDATELYAIVEAGPAQSDAWDQVGALI